MDESKRCALVNTIKLFGFGTLREYYELKNDSGEGGEGSGGVWTLTDAQLEKLRMLSVVTVVRQFYQTKRQQKEEQEGGADVEMMDSGTTAAAASSSGEEHTLSIPYDLLVTELQITSNDSNNNNAYNNVMMRQLEDVLIQCVYSNIISGKLDQATKSFIVDSHLLLGMKGGGDSSADYEANSTTTVHGSLLSRDIDTTTPISTSASIKSMISQLTSFLTSSNTLLVQLENLEKISVVTRNEDEKRWRNVEKKMEKKGGSGGGGRELENWEIGHPKQLSFADSGAASAASGGGGGERKVKRSRGGHTMGGR